MLPHLNSIHKEYTQQPNESGCNPISLTDCQLIEELIRIAPHDIGQLLSMWKMIPDETFMDFILKYKGNEEEVDTGDRNKERGKENRPYPYIKINRKMMAVYNIRSMEPLDRYDEDGNELYSILINKEPIPVQFAFYVNTMIDFSTEEERDNEIQRIEDKMTEYGYCTFI